MKKLFLLIAISFIFASHAAADPLSGCVYVNRPDTRTSGRFIWKQSGAHFPGNGVIVTPRYYYPYPPIVTLHQNVKGYPAFETVRLKSTGICPSSPECLHAATFLTSHNGNFYQRKYGSMIVRVVPRYSSLNQKCSFYLIKKPSVRAEFHNGS